ncbi:MAG TPA: DUF1802 family protein [Chthoniobacterales bacterium]|nr:DUF1802 family protein [Chthoniobacterales bacterium]
MPESPVISNHAHPTPGLLPGIGFKEWALVCDSMLRGETSLIFRKGGIAEGRQGFRFKHSQFFLFPTYFHEQISQTRLDPSRDLEPQTESIPIEAFACVEFTVWISELKQIEPLSEFHILRPELIEKRFNQDEVKGLHLAFVRIFRVLPAWQLTFQRSFGGCRSWIDLPVPSLDLECRQVLSDEEHERRRECVKSLR